MELVKLTFQNINALAGTWTVDFQSLAEEAGGLFAIVGPTGSGKTSLLDAISLALFGTTPRVCPADERSTKRGQDVSSCITKGYTQAMAELTFLHDGHRYCTRCTLHTSSPNAFVLKVDGEEKSYTRTEALRKVEEILRMDYAAFSRTLLLAQGHFNKFLAAKSEDRLETLSTIAGVGDYQRIADALKARVTKNRKELEAQQNKANWSANQVLPEAELQAKTEALVGLHEEVMASQQRKAAIAPKVLQWREVCALKQEVERIASALPELRQLAEQRVAEERAALQARETLHMEAQRQRLTEAQVAEQQRNRDALALQEAEQALGERTQAYQKAALQFKTLQAREEEEAKAQETRLSWLQAHALDQGLTEALPGLKGMANEAQRQQEAVNSQQRLTTLAEKFVTQATEALELAKKGVGETQKHVALAQKRLEKACEDVKSREALMAKLEAEGKAFVNTSWPDAKRAEEAEEGWASYRESLEHAEPCPLCGSKAHPYVDTPEVLAKHQAWIARWKEQQEALAQAQKALEKARREEHEASMQADSAKNDVAQTTERVHAKQVALEEATQKAEEAKALLKTLQEALAHAQKEFADALGMWMDLPKKVEAKVPQALVERQKQYAQTHAATETYLQKHEPLLKELRAASEQLAMLKGQVDVAATGKASAVQAYEVSQKAFEAFGCEHPKAALEALEERFRVLSEAYDVAQKAATQAQAEVQSAQKTLEERKATLQAKSEGLPESGEGETLEQEISALEERLQTLMSEEGKLRGLLEEDEKRRKEHASLLKELEAMQLESSRWTSLEKFLDNEALKKVAQNLLLVRLLEIANERLQRLLPRYTLRAIDQQESKEPGVTPIRAMEIMIEDAWLGGELRTTTNLSGGESFLISLVLAISLSDLSSQHFQLKNLFLDEGFGTLDGDCLQKALAILENLHAEGRLVGIISHVEQLKRAPVRIELRPSSTTSGFSSLACYVNDEARPEIVFGDTSKESTGRRAKHRRKASAENVTPASEEAYIAQEISKQS